MKSFLLFSQLCLFSCLAQNQRYVTVTTPQGAMQGAKLDYGTNTSGLYYGSAYGFMGVPYAQPPTGQLRFSEPVTVQPSNRLYDATYLRGRCPQSGSNPGPVSEDCLYLNIFTTQVGNSSTLNAVMVFIGGDQGFTRGGANQAEIPGTVRNLVTRGVVVVTVQYRLGALGFFNLANSGVPQNLGMLDQVMALQWIQSNIRVFGGDPSRITLCGQSDGGCAVAAHAVSPLSNGLFQQAILQSGSVYSCYQDNQQSLPLQSTPMPTLQYNSGLQYLPLTNQQSNQQQQYYQPPPPSSTFSPPTSTRAPTVNDEDPSLQIAMQLCNVSSDQLRAGYSNARLRTCLQSLSVDIFIQFQGYRTSKWLIVRDNSFMPNSPDALAQMNPRRIPMIIGTVQDEDADYVFRMIADGSEAGKSEQQLFDGWFVDFAKKNKLKSTDAGQVRNIIENNYGIAQPSSNQQFYNQNNGQYNQPNQNYQIVGQSNANNYNSNYNSNNNNQLMQQQPTNTYQQTSYTNTQFTQSNNGNNQQNVQYLQVISKISSDANGISQSVSQVNLMQQQGANTRIFQFTHVSELGRNSVPNTGNWKPVFRGQDQYFLFMSETIWTTGNPTAADLRVADEMGSRWTQFAKNGQVQGWDSTPPGQYNYCNLNVNPVMQSNYAPQARQVFNEQVYPIVEQRPPPSVLQYSPSSSQNANVMVHNTNGTDAWSVSFSLPAFFPNL